MNRRRMNARPAAGRYLAPPGNRGNARFAPVVAALLLLCGCGGTAYVKIDGVETSDRKIVGPVQPNLAGKPQLSFCVTKGLLRSSDRNKSGALKDDDYYHAHLADLLRRDAPFESIATVLGNFEGRGCDVVLVPCTYIRVAPGGQVEASLAVTALAADMRKTLLTASVRDEPGMEAAGARIGRIVYNAFIPGSALYDRVASGKGTSLESFEEAAGRGRNTPVKPALPEAAGR